MTCENKVRVKPAAFALCSAIGAALALLCACPDAAAAGNPVYVQQLPAVLFWDLGQPLSPKTVPLARRRADHKLTKVSVSSGNWTAVLNGERVVITPTNTAQLAVGFVRIETDAADSPPVIIPVGIVDRTPTPHRQNDRPPGKKGSARPQPAASQALNK
jgi:hypothetical protein